MIPDFIPKGHFEADASESSSEAEELAAIEKDEKENHADFVVSDSVVDSEPTEEDNVDDPDYETDETLEVPGVDQLCSNCVKKLCKDCKKLLE